MVLIVTKFIYFTGLAYPPMIQSIPKVDIKRPQGRANRITAVRSGVIKKR